MNTREPKEREHYRICLEDGTLVEVTREVYLCWYQMRRKERYQIEKESKHHVYSLEALQKMSYYSDLSISDDMDVEKIILQQMESEEIREMIMELSDYEQEIIYCLYYLELNTKETAEMLGRSRCAIGQKKQKLLRKLRRWCKYRKIEMV